ncbi:MULTISPECIES: cell wall metabolism sensor histidine kinase WalK [unclassified Meiothermus]|uniref:sensor histidine kinase n=1 Tax=unclassified Meiothermus TaxID=370471 RepID=UPI000D7CA8BC|nr:MULTISPECIES: HAMP domain-containing sensor histidine kinase [unclassified Meiothermus]PZA06132.1 two-component sensor histidine kinase [Meiothermus sp. Pnk-1]RYM35406.1 HAMP domain-containing histidine kinase [Meiothermus sp. PNK-Is4]
MFTRLFLTHLLAALVAVVALLGFAEWLAPRFYQKHIEQMAAAMGPQGPDLHADLERGLRSTLTAAWLASLPLAGLLAAGTAWVVSRRVSHSVRLLARGSREIAQGHYRNRLKVQGHDELASLAQDFNRMAEALERVEQSRIELIGSVAHELRTPLAGLQGYAEALADGVLPPEQAADRIRHEVRAMRRLVEDLSLVSRVEAGAVEIRPQALDPAEALRQAAERFALAFREQGVALELELPAQLPAVRADPERLQQVLSNLLSNALRHTPPGGEVGLKAEPARGGVRFSVRDTGPGIPPEHQARVFERFYRVDPARSRQEGGSGVGLTVARGLVEAMGGNMGLESEVGHGSTFWFTLPPARS